MTFLYYILSSDGVIFKYINNFLKGGIGFLP